MHCSVAEAGEDCETRTVGRDRRNARCVPFRKFVNCPMLLHLSELQNVSCLVWNRLFMEIKTWLFLFYFFQTAIDKKFLFGMERAYCSFYTNCFTNLLLRGQERPMQNCTIIFCSFCEAWIELNYLIQHLVKTIEQEPYSPDMNPCDFFCSPSWN